MCDFKPGDEVVCVKQDDAGILRVGQTYTIDQVVESITMGRGVTLFDVSFPAMFEGRRVLGFCSSRFRKVQRRSSETGMAILKSICDNPGQLEEDTKQDQVEEAARMVFGPWGDYTDDGTFGLR